MLTGMKPRLSLLRIIEMNVGFFGLQFSFGLQQANMGPIYGFLGADEATGQPMVIKDGRFGPYVTDG